MSTKESMSVLVVDDEKMMRDLVERILSKEGFAVDTAPSGKEALKKLEKNPVDLIISDIKMPGMDGLELLKAVKSKHPDISVIMMTAFGDTYAVKDALLLGADEYVTKPFKSDEMTFVVERVYWRLLSSRNQELNAH